MAESDFTELLHAAEQLSAEVEGSGDLPKVERTLRQVLEASTELWSRVTQAGAQDIQAYVFAVRIYVEAKKVYDECILSESVWLCCNLQGMAHILFEGNLRI